MQRRLCGTRYLDHRDRSVENVGSDPTFAREGYPARSIEAVRGSQGADSWATLRCFGWEGCSYINRSNRKGVRGSVGTVKLLDLNLGGAVGAAEGKG